MNHSMVSPEFPTGKKPKGRRPNKQGNQTDKIDQMNQADEIDPEYCPRQKSAPLKVKGNLTIHINKAYN